MDYATYLQNLMSNLNPDVQAGMMGGAVQAPQGFVMPQPTPTYATQPSPMPGRPMQPQRELTDIEKLYRDVLGRAPDTGGSDYWTKQFLEDGTIDATERKTFEQAALPEIELTKLYQDVLKRAPDTGGSAYWAKQFLEDGVIDENERKTFEQAALPEIEITKLYQDVLGRAPDPAGFEYWKKQFMADGVIDENERKMFEEFAPPEEQRMLSTQNPMRPDISSVMKAMQAARNTQQGYLAPQRTDLNAIREQAFTSYDNKKKEKEALEAALAAAGKLIKGPSNSRYNNNINPEGYEYA